jgi:hypothetical protein
VIGACEEVSSCEEASVEEIPGSLVIDEKAGCSNEEAPADKKAEETKAMDSTRSGSSSESIQENGGAKEETGTNGKIEYEKSAY